MNWRKLGPGYWASLYYDVFLEYGVWRASFYIGRAFDSEFSTAAEAMRFSDYQYGPKRAKAEATDQPAANRQPPTQPVRRVAVRENNAATHD